MDKTVNTSEQLEEVCDALIERIHELEECWRRGVLRLPLSCDEVRLFLGPVAAPYDALDVAPDEPITSFRANWMRMALDEFVSALSRPRAHVGASVVANGLYGVNQNGEQLTLRLDQAISARFWGVGLELENSEHAVGFTNRVWSSALARLANEIGCVGKMCKAAAEKRIFPEAIRWRTEGYGASFEHLAMDLLNEDARRARRAKLFEDLFEWTDLRVQYPNLPRKNGARVQVKFIGSKFDEKIPIRLNTETHVLFSPVALASYVEEICEGRRRPDLEEEFWDSLGAKPADSVELAKTFFRLFQSAIAAQATHPMGPLSLVPPIVRRLIRRFVCDQSFEAATRMTDALNLRNSAARTWTRRL